MSGHLPSLPDKLKPSALKAIDLLMPHADEDRRFIILATCPRRIDRLRLMREWRSVLPRGQLAEMRMICGFADDPRSMV